MNQEEQSKAWERAICENKVEITETIHQNRNQIESPNHFSSFEKKNILKFKVIIFNHNKKQFKDKKQK
jgi:hypothetical protein